MAQKKNEAKSEDGYTLKPVDPYKAGKTVKREADAEDDAPAE